MVSRASPTPCRQVHGSAAALLVPRTTDQHHLVQRWPDTTRQDGLPHSQGWRVHTMWVCRPRQTDGAARCMLGAATNLSLELCMRPLLLLQRLRQLAALAVCSGLCVPQLGDQRCLLGLLLLQLCHLLHAMEEDRVMLTKPVPDRALCCFYCCSFCYCSSAASLDAKALQLHQACLTWGDCSCCALQ